MSLKRFVKVTFIWCLSVFWTIVMSCTVFVQFVRSPRKFFFRKSRTERPKCLDDPAFSHGYARLKTIRMHYVSTGEEGKPLMLLLHGFPDFWYVWRNQLREFGKDYRVVAVDNRGYNETDEPLGIESYMVHELREDYKQLIEALGYNSCVLVGHDWGGCLAWDFTANYPECVSKLIILNGPNEAFREVLETNWKQFMMSWYMFLFQMPYFPEWWLYRNDLGVFNAYLKPLIKKGMATEEDVEAWKYSHRKSLTGPINYYRAMMRYKLKTKANRNFRYSLPTLVLWSEKDLALSVDLGRKVAAKATNCTFHVVPEASHSLQQEYPDTTNKLIREWLETGTVRQ